MTNNTPWTSIMVSDEETHESYSVVNSSKGIVANVISAQHLENAELIVEAVNNHDRLKAKEAMFDELLDNVKAARDNLSDVNDITYSLIDYGCSGDITRIHNDVFDVRNELNQIMNKAKRLQEGE